MLIPIESILNPTRLDGVKVQFVAPFHDHRCSPGMITVALAKGALLKDSVARFAALVLISLVCLSPATVS